MTRASRNAALIACALLAGCNPFKDRLTLTRPSSIAAPSLRPFADGTNWILERDLVFVFKDEEGREWPEIRVPQGFVTDLASIPQFAQLIRSRVGTYSRAAILHDYLYATGVCPSRRQADVILYRAMKSSGSSDAVAMQIYVAVRAGGERPFKENKELRDKGVVRSLTTEQFHLADDHGWIKLRDQLPHIEPGPQPPMPAYCAMGGPADDS